MTDDNNDSRVRVLYSAGAERIATSNTTRARQQTVRVEQLCDFLEHPALRRAIEQIPVSMPPAVGSLGFDAAFWVGYGLVGLWAALDAFGERASLSGRCAICRRPFCVAGRFEPFARENSVGLQELDDLRHLYAHNYAGDVDEDYARKRRHVLKRDQPLNALTCGRPFDGRSIQLPPSALRHYANVVRTVLLNCA